MSTVTLANLAFLVLGMGIGALCVMVWQWWMA